LAKKCTFGKRVLATVRGSRKGTSNLAKALFATEQYMQFPGLAQAETIFKKHI
jgi:hypothetical protein